MNSGQATIAHAWSGDVYQMYDDVPNVRYVIPKEGAVRGSDTMVVTSGAPHPIAANMWINFNLDAKVSAANTIMIPCAKLNTPEALKINTKPSAINA